MESREEYPGQGAGDGEEEERKKCQRPGKVCSLLLVGAGLTFLIPACVFLIGFQSPIVDAIGISVISLASVSILTGFFICIYNIFVKKETRDDGHRSTSESGFVMHNRTTPQTATNLPRASGSFRGSLDIIRVDSFRPSEEVIQEIQKSNDPPPSYEEVVGSGEVNND